MLIPLFFPDDPPFQRLSHVLCVHPSGPPRLCASPRLPPPWFQSFPQSIHFLLVDAPPLHQFFRVFVATSSSISVDQPTATFFFSFSTVALFFFFFANFACDTTNSGTLCILLIFNFLLSPLPTASSSHHVGASPPHLFPPTRPQSVHNANFGPHAERRRRRALHHDIILKLHLWLWRWRRWCWCSESRAAVHVQCERSLLVPE